MKTKTASEAADLLVRIESLNVLLFAEGSSLIARPGGVLPPELCKRLVELKPALLEIAPRRRWRVTPPGREAFNVDCAGHPMTADDIGNIWTGAIVEPP